MQFTFGIITAGDGDSRIQEIIDSIESQHIPEYEILIVGNSKIERNHTKIIPFEESIKSGWITKKKNFITEEAKYENIVYLHDYLIFMPGWYKGFVNFGNDFQLCMNPIQNADGSRFTDWTLDPWTNARLRKLLPHQTNSDGSIYLACLLPYSETRLSKYMYFSGSYWVAKKSVMQEFPLNEALTHGGTEDAYWSSQVREKYSFSINSLSTVKCLKQKPRNFIEIDPLLVDKILDLNQVTLGAIFKKLTAIIKFNA